MTTLDRSERFFYDGTRRVQELITDPLLYNEDHDIITMANELYAGQPGSNVLVAGAPYVRAMYVWGPGDSPTSCVDELLVQIDPRDTGTGSVSSLGGKPWYAVNDAQGDLVALLHKQSTTATVQIAAQWTYSPYGEVLSYEQFHPHPVVVFGHKSLVVDRLDTQPVSWDTDLGTLSDTQRLVPGAKLLGYNRGRTTNFALGRFMQTDPNASGLALQSSILFHGIATGAFEATVNVQTRLGDGLNLFGYLGSNPITRYDPMGLSSDPFDMVDDFATTNAAQQAAFMEQLRGGFNATAHIAWQLAQLNPAIGMAASIYNISTGNYSYWDFVNLIPIGGKAVSLLAAASREMRAVKAAYGANRAAMVGRTMQRGQKTLTITAEMAEHIGKIDRYDALQALTKGAAHAIEAHHSIPTRYLRFTRGLTKESAPAVVMAYEDHRMIETLISTAEREVLAGRAIQSADDVGRVLRRAYERFPEFMSRIQGQMP